MTRIDLHTHTTASDGTLEPAQLIELAAANDVDVIGVADHDTTAGVAATREAGRAAGVEVVAGIEVSSRDEGRNVHVLGCFVDETHPGLVAAMDGFRTERARRAERMVAKLNDLGFEITMDDVRREAAGVVGRPHVARALVARGHVTSVRKAFTDDLLADGGAAYVPYPTFTPGEAVALIRAAGGAAVVAHPGVIHHAGRPAEIPYALLERLTADGLAGLEVNHPDQPPELRDRLRALARGFGLVPTGGSDCHGPHGPPPGTCITAPEAFSALRDRAG